LLESKEQEVEKALWSTCAFLLHVELLYKQMQREMKQFNGVNRMKVKRRIEEARRQKGIIEELIHSSHAWDGTCNDTA
jgi:hypothetical protein